MATTRLYNTSGTATGATKYTLSMWIKRSKLSSEMNLIGVSSGNTIELIKFNANDKLYWYNRDAASNAAENYTSNVFRDTSGWYHLVFSYDSTESSAANQRKIYINGVNQTWASAAAVQSNAVPGMNLSGAVRNIGAESTPSNYFSGLMTQVIFIDGTVYTPSTFGSINATSGIWVGNTSPTVTYGTNGYNLDMANSSDMGNDVSGNANDFTVSGTLTQAKDCPSNVFATMNRESPTTVALADMANGNLYNGDQSPNKWQGIPGTLAAEKGKIYWEVKIENVWGNTSQNSQRHGIGNIAAAVDNNTSDAYDIQWTSAAYGIGWCNSSGVRNSGNVTATGNYSTFVATNILMFAMDLDNLKLYLGKNGVWEYSGDPTSGASGTGAYTIPAAGMWAPYSETRYGSDTISWNIGNGSFRTVAVSSAGTNASANGIFEYDVPTGYTALSTKGLNL